MALCIVAVLGLAFFVLFSRINILTVGTGDVHTMLVTEASAPQDAGSAPQAGADVSANASHKVTITFAGDCTLGKDDVIPYDRSFNALFKEKGPAYFLKNFAPLFGADDLTVVNLEGTITDSNKRAAKKFAFKGKPEYLEALTDASVEAVTLANNHSHDYGEKSYTDTIEACKNAGLISFGYDRIAYREINGVKVALIGTYELARGMEIEGELLSNIKKAQDEGAQLIVVDFHWGTEYGKGPNQNQKRLGRAAIDAGAHVVVGSHAHILQGYEKYKGRYIIYSLANFCFGGNTNPPDKDTLVFQQTFSLTDGKIADDDDVKFIPAKISSSNSRNNYQPTPAEGEEAARIMRKLEERSKA